MSPCFIESIELGSELVLNVVELYFEGFNESWDGVASRVFGFIPLEVVKVFTNIWLFFNAFQVPVVELLVLEVQVLFVDFFEEAFNTGLDFENFVV